MDLAKHSLKVMVSQLLPTDAICIIGFQSNPEIYFKSNSMTPQEKKRALDAIETVVPPPSGSMTLSFPLLPHP